MFGHKLREEKASAAAEKIEAKHEHEVVKQAADETLIDRIVHTSRLARLLNVPIEDHLSDLASFIADGERK